MQLMAFKCPFCPENDPMKYITKQHLVIHINHNHPAETEMVNKGLR